MVTMVQLWEKSTIIMTNGQLGSLSAAEEKSLFAFPEVTNYTYTLGEAASTTTEVPYPSVGLNLPSTALTNTSDDTSLPTNNVTGMISVQALVITPATGSRPETLWVPDTGITTVTGADGTTSMLYAAPGDPRCSASVYPTTQYTIRDFSFPPAVH